MTVGIQKFRLLHWPLGWPGLTPQTAEGRDGVLEVLEE